MEEDGVAGSSALGSESQESDAAFHAQVKAQGVSVQVSVCVESETETTARAKADAGDLQPELEADALDDKALRKQGMVVVDGFKKTESLSKVADEQPESTELNNDTVNPAQEQREQHVVAKADENGTDKDGDGDGNKTPATPSSTSGVEQWFEEEEEDDGTKDVSIDTEDPVDPLVVMDEADVSEQQQQQSETRPPLTEVIDVQGDSDSDQYETASSDEEPVATAASRPRKSKHKRRRRPSSPNSSSSSCSPHRHKKRASKKRDPPVIVHYSKANSTWSHKSQEEILQEFKSFQVPPTHGEAEPIMKGRYYFDDSINRAIFEGKWGFEGSDFERIQNVSAFYYKSAYLQTEGLFPYCGGYGGWFEFRPFSQKVRKIPEKQLELLFVPIPRNDQDAFSAEDDEEEDSDSEVMLYRVYGKGRNQFGEYHLLGKYNMRTETMELKRRYDG